MFDRTLGDVKHNGRRYGGVSHSRYTEIVKLEFQKRFGKRGISINLNEAEEFYNNIESGRGANGKVNDEIKKFNDAVKRHIPKSRRGSKPKPKPKPKQPKPKPTPKPPGVRGTLGGFLAGFWASLLACPSHEERVAMAALIDASAGARRYKRPPQDPEVVAVNQRIMRFLEQRDK